MKERAISVRAALDKALCALAAGEAVWAQDGCGGRGSAVSPGAWLDVACGGDVSLTVAAMHRLDRYTRGRFAAWQRDAEHEELLNVIERAMLTICGDCGADHGGQYMACPDCYVAGLCPDCGRYFPQWQDQARCASCDANSKVEGYIHARGET